MAKIDFGGVVEEVITSEEFSLEKAQKVLENETVAVLGYGVQGPGQALNMQDNGIRVIVGQREGSPSWSRAVEDGFVPGETLFPLEEAAKRATVIQYLVSDAGQVATWPVVKKCLNPGDALYFSHGFAITYKDHTGIVPAEGCGCDSGSPQRFRKNRSQEFFGRQRYQLQLCHLSGLHRSCPRSHPGSGRGHRFGVSVPHHL